MPEPEPTSSRQKIHRQFLRYLFVGAFNTLFGYCTFAVFNFVLHSAGIPVSYIFAFALSNVINITVAWLNYKLFVFHTRGNYLREWIKAMAVYWSASLPGIILLPVLVRVLNWTLPAQIYAFHHNLARHDLAPYIASAILLVFTVFYSFLGHRNLTFREALARKSNPPVN